MIDPKSTSDDEADPLGLKENGRPVHWIRNRPERSMEANRFYRRLEATMEHTAKLEGKRIRGRIRKVPDQPKDSDFRAIPHDAPIDYFDPAFFNHLQPRLRRQCTSQKIALLPDIEKSFTRCDDEFISDQDFSRKFGNVLLRYKLSDLDNLDEEESFIDDNDEEDIIDDDDDF